MNTALLISGFVVGLAGSLHCIGMCGPLSLVLPFGGMRPLQKFFALLAYQLGRISTYAILGFVFAYVGRQLFISGIQQTISLLIGVLVIGVAIVMIAGRSAGSRNWWHSVLKPVRDLFDRTWHAAWKTQHFFLIGMVNGLLPCGMIFVALLATLSLNKVWEGPVFMTGFGLGTLPAMMGAVYALQRLRSGGRLMLRRIVPYFMLVMGIWIVLRGMDLGIPFVSPQVPHTVSAVSCK